MNAGQLDERIEFWKFETTKNELGEDQPQAVSVKKAWAKVEPRTGSLLTGRPADTMLSKTTHVVTVRSETLMGVTYGCWINWTDMTGNVHRLDIDYILPPVRTNRFATIYVQEVL